MSLFEKAPSKGRRLKMYIYGDTGTGKTVTSLHFPNPAIIDTEKGSEHYGQHFKFFRLETSNPAKIHAALDELLKNPGEFKTLIIDSFSNVWDTIQDIQLSRMKVKSGNPNYAIQPLDYKAMNAEVKSIVSKLLALDLNIIVTARSKVLYSTDKSEFMQVIGTQPDGPKNLPYMFDTVLELTKDDEKRMAIAHKDRTNSLPHEFEFTYKAFTDALGIEGLEREPIVFQQQETHNQLAHRNTEISYNGNDIKTAGITANTLDQLSKAVEVLGEKLVMGTLKGDYLVDSFLDLKDDEALLLVKDLDQKRKQ